MARFWPKWRYNGRVMAREVSFYQCLWVTKFWAKFGCSRTPRTARAPNSFIVLRCMWKEPAPLGLRGQSHRALTTRHILTTWVARCTFDKIGMHPSAQPAASTQISRPRKHTFIKIGRFFLHFMVCVVSSPWVWPSVSEDVWLSVGWVGWSRARTTRQWWSV